MAHLTRLGLGNQAFFYRFGAHTLAVDAGAVVDDLDDHLATLVLGPDQERPGLGLAGSNAVGGLLDAVVDRIANDVGQRVLDGLDDGAVELGFLTLGLEGDVFLTGACDVPDDSGKLAEDVAHRLHPGLHDPFLQLARDQVESLAGVRQFVILNLAGELKNLVPRKHKLLDQVHQALEKGNIHPDGRLGHRRFFGRSRNGDLRFHWCRCCFHWCRIKSLINLYRGRFFRFFIHWRDCRFGLGQSIEPRKRLARRLESGIVLRLRDRCGFRSGGGSFRRSTTFCIMGFFRLVPEPHDQFDIIFLALSAGLDQRGKGLVDGVGSLDDESDTIGHEKKLAITHF